MTAAAQWLMMTATTVNIATGITAQSAAPIAKSVIPQSAWGVLMNVPRAMSRSVRAVLPNARNAKRRSVRIV